MKWFDPQGAAIALTFGTFNTILVFALYLTLEGRTLHGFLHSHQAELGALAVLWASTCFCTKRGWYGIGRPLRGRVDVGHTLSSGAWWGAGSAALFIMAIAMFFVGLGVVDMLITGIDEGNAYFAVIAFQLGLTAAFVAAIVGAVIGPFVALIDVLVLLIVRSFFWWLPRPAEGSR